MQDGFKVVRKVTAHGDLLPGARVQEGESAGVQALGVLSQLRLFVAIDCVAQNGVAQIGQMDADLVGSAGFQLQLQMGIAGVAGQHLSLIHISSNPALTERVEADIEEFLAANPGLTREDIPTDLVTASGSGLDPHISPASAEVQVAAVAAASGLSEEEIRQIVADNTEGKVLGVFGENRVNVLGVNLDIAQAMGLISEQGEQK